jgi:hypothetical protein
MMTTPIQLVELPPTVTVGPRPLTMSLEAARSRRTVPLTCLTASATFLSTHEVSRSGRFPPAARLLI